MPKSCGSPGPDGVHRPERPEQHVAERAVHRPAHDDGEDDPGRAVERPGHDQQLDVEHDAQGGGREAGVAVQQRDHRRHVGAADRDDQEDAEGQRQDGDHRDDPGLARGRPPAPPPARSRRPARRRSRAFWSG